MFQNIVLHRLRLPNIKSVTNEIFKSMVNAIVRDDLRMTKAKNSFISEFKQKII